MIRPGESTGFSALTVTVIERQGQHLRDNRPLTELDGRGVREDNSSTTRQKGRHLPS
jgi:hypothetical protein